MIYLLGQSKQGRVRAEVAVLAKKCDEHGGVPCRVQSWNNFVNNVCHYKGIPSNDDIVFLTGVEESWVKDMLVFRGFNNVIGPNQIAAEFEIDKWKAMQFVKNGNFLDVPESYLLSHLYQFGFLAEKINSPLVLKRRFFNDRFGFPVKVGNLSSDWETMKSELEYYLADEDGEIRFHDCCHQFIISKKAQGIPMAVTAYINSTAVIPLFQGGYTNVPEIDFVDKINPDIVRKFSPLWEALKNCGFEGFCNIEFLYEPSSNKFWFFEINARAPLPAGSLFLSMFDDPLGLCRLLLSGNNIELPNIGASLLLSSDSFDFDDEAIKKPLLDIGRLEMSRDVVLHHAIKNDDNIKITGRSPAFVFGFGKDIEAALCDASRKSEEVHFYGKERTRALVLLFNNEIENVRNTLVTNWILRHD